MKQADDIGWRWGDQIEEDVMSFNWDGFVKHLSSAHVRQLRHCFGPFLTHFSARTTQHTPCGMLCVLNTHAMPASRLAGHAFIRDGGAMRLTPTMTPKVSATSCGSPTPRRPSRRFTSTFVGLRTLPLVGFVQPCTGNLARVTFRCPRVRCNAVTFRNW